MLMYLNLIFSSNLNESSLGNYNFRKFTKSTRNIRNSPIILPSFRRLTEIFWLSRMLPLNISEENKFS